VIGEDEPGGDVELLAGAEALIVTRLAGAAGEVFTSHAGRLGG
jgi:hypothetical protein